MPYIGTCLFIAITASAMLDASVKVLPMTGASEIMGPVSSNLIAVFPDFQAGETRLQWLNEKGGTTKYMNLKSSRVRLGTDRLGNLILLASTSTIDDLSHVSIQKRVVEDLYHCDFYISGWIGYRETAQRERIVHPSGWTWILTLPPNRVGPAVISAQAGKLFSVSTAADGYIVYRWDLKVGGHASKPQRVQIKHLVSPNIVADQEGNCFILTGETHFENDVLKPGSRAGFPAVTRPGVPRSNAKVMIWKTHARSLSTFAQLSEWQPSEVDWARRQLVVFNSKAIAVLLDSNRLAIIQVGH